jgi:hypothetical protein
MASQAAFLVVRAKIAQAQKALHHMEDVDANQRALATAHPSLYSEDAHAESMATNVQGHHFAQDLGSDLRIQGRSLEFLVAQQDLDYTDVDLLFEQVSGIRMTQRVHGHALIEFGNFSGLVDGAVELAGAQRLV